MLNENSSVTILLLFLEAYLGFLSRFRRRFRSRAGSYTDEAEGMMYIAVVT